MISNARRNPHTSSPLPDLADGFGLRNLLVYAFALRVGLAFLLELSGMSIRFAPDEETYASSGWQLALYWQGETLVKPWRFTTDQPLGYFYLNAVFFSVFGRTQLPVKIANCAAGAVACRYLYLIARDLFGSIVARRAATLMAFLPSLVLWSALNIRDVWVILVIVFISWKSLQIVKGYSTLALVQLLLAVGLLSTLRDYLFFVVALPPIVALLIGQRGNSIRNVFLAGVASLGIVLFVQHGLVSERSESHLSLETMSRLRQQMAIGESSYAEEVDISSPAKALAFLPTGLVYFFFSPFPWEITSFLRAVSLPEMLVIYFMTPATIRGMRYAIQNRFRESLQVLLLTSLLTVSYALGEGNVGTLYRHRAQVIAFYIMFATVGLELRRQSVPVLRPA